MIAALVLAAGTSSRYGTNKLLLPFGSGTVISTTVSAVARAGVRPIVVVTGHERAEVEAALPDLPITFVHNPDYRAGEMVSSVKTGLRYLKQLMNTQLRQPFDDAAMIVLGDQPLLKPAIVAALATAFAQQCGEIVAPRYGLHGRRGHPVVISRKWWDEALALPADGNVRDVLRAHENVLAHIVLDTDAILLDVDTPEAYKATLIEAGKVERAG